MTQRLPEQFTERMKAMLGTEYEAFLASYETERVQGLRLNPLKGETAAVREALLAAFHLKEIPWAENGWYYRQEERPGKHPFHEAGLYYIQEPSAMAVVELLSPKPGERVLDLCAAPGGKSTQAAGKLLGKGLLVCNEIHPARAKILAQNVERMGAANVVVTNHDSEALTRWFPEFFDRIITDAPCSGEGMFRKDEHAREEWSPDNVKLCASRQGEILDNAARMLKPGGYLVYSTCTFAPEENEGAVLAFLKRHPEFSVVSGEREFPWFSSGQPEWVMETAGQAEGHAEGQVEGQAEGRTGEQLEELKKTCRIWPHRVEGEGHFLALLKKAGGISKASSESAVEAGLGSAAAASKRQDGSQDKRNRKTGNTGNAGNTINVLTKEQKKVFEEFCEDTLLPQADQNSLPDQNSQAGRNLQADQNSQTDRNSLPEERSLASGPVWEQEPGRYLMFGEQLYFVPADMPDLKGMKVLRPGLHLGTFKKNRFEPSHALALYLKQTQVKAAASFPADSPELVHYLKGETLNVDSSLKGWTLVCADGFSLGWGKAANGVLKNHYPKGLRWN